MQRCPNPRSTANFLSTLTFWWTWEIFKKGNRRPLEEADLYAPLNDHKSSILGDKAEKLWKSELERNPSAPSLLRVFLNFFGLRMFLYTLLLIIAEGLNMAQPLFLGKLIRYFTPGSDVARNDALKYASTVVLCSILGVGFLHFFYYSASHLGMKMRIMSSSLIYRKSLRLRLDDAADAVGRVMTLMNADAASFERLFTMVHYLWLGPLQALVVASMLWAHVGLPSLTGLVYLVLCIPLYGYLGKKTTVLRPKIASKNEERVKLTQEIIDGIKTIKTNAWEEDFNNLVNVVRRGEIYLIRKMLKLQALSLSFGLFSTRLAVFISILVTFIVERQVTAEKVFVTVAYYNILRRSLTYLIAIAVRQLSESLVSVERMKTFLLTKETAIPKPFVKEDLQLPEELVPINRMTNDSNAKAGVVLMEHVFANWGKEDVLKNVSLNAAPGQLIVVIGPVGSGKSSLLLAMLREMDLRAGTAELHGKVALVAQEPWLFSGSLRHNVLFGQPFHREKYEQALRLCALDLDVSRLEDGDATSAEALSGGQKARLCLARAIYAEADIYLLDDPLSAVDNHVGRHLYGECIRGHLKNKTCILVTHQLQYIQDADQIIILNKGEIEVAGSYSELQKSSVDFSNLLVAPDKEAPTPDNCINDTDMGERAQRTTALKEERQSSGGVRGRVYLQYLRGGSGRARACVLLGGFVLTEVLASGSDYWLSLWVNSGGGESCMHVLVLAALMGGQICAAVLRALGLLATCVRASSSLHRLMLSSMLGANVSYFYANPSGRIVNHFSKDLSLVDEGLPPVIYSTVQIFLNSVGIVVVVAMADAWLLVPAVVVAGLLYALRSFYLASSRSLKRLEAITKSPVLSHVKASLQGLSTIRAFEAQRQLEQEFDDHQDTNTSASYLFLSLDQAFGVWMDIGCLIYLTMVTFSFLVIDKGWHGGDVGLAIALSLRLTGMIQYGVRQWATLETNMTSVERLINFTKIPQEPLLEYPSGAMPPNDWPKLGSIEFRNVSLKYRSDGQPALKNLSFLVEGGAKVGVVGRTGAGKTSLLSALLLLADDVQGAVLVDGLDVAPLARRSFRARLGVVTQDLLFRSGPVRRILDLKGTLPDGDLWSALQEVRLRDHVSDLDISSKWCAGEKQLLAVARMILRPNKIIILDEATSSVDPETDSFIHEMIKTKFQQSTVLTISHRLQTVIESDKIMVIDDGKIMEYDTPYCLLQNPDGYLYKMAEKLGRTTLEQFIDIAGKHIERRLSPGEHGSGMKICEDSSTQ